MIFSKKTSVTWRTQRIDLKKWPLHEWELLWICGFCQFSFGRFEQWIDQSLLCKKEKIIEYFFPLKLTKVFCDVTDTILWRDGRSEWDDLKLHKKTLEFDFFILKLILFHLFSLICGSEVLKCFQWNFIFCVRHVTEMCPSCHRNVSVTSQKCVRHVTKFLKPIWTI